MKKLFFAIAGLFFASLCFGATVKTTYPNANPTQLTITSLNSLATCGSPCIAGWQSDFVDNNTNQDLFDIVHVKVSGAAAGVSATGTISVYVYSCGRGQSGAGNCDDTATGRNGAITVTNPTNLILALTLNLVANNGVAVGSFNVAQLFGGAVPARWGVVILNNSGAALAASGNAVSYDSVQMISQ